MKITVLGVGAIGGLFAHRLCAHHDVQTWTRHSSPTHTFTFVDRDKRHHTHTLPNHQIDELMQSDVLLVCVKAFQLESALTPLIDTLPTTTAILVCHNGMGTHDWFKEHFPSNPLYYAMTTEAALTQEGTVHHTGNGNTLIGAFPSPAPDLPDTLVSALQAQFVEHIENALWQKLAINCVINPLTAQFNVKNGDLLKDEYAKTVTDLCQELSQVMNAEGFPVQAEVLESQIRHVMALTAENCSSMHQDKTHQRQTEMPYITGYLCQCAKKHRIDVPTHQHLLNLSQQWKIAQ